MAFRAVVLVMEEHLPKAVEELSKNLAKFAEIHKIPFEDKYLLDVKSSVTHKCTQALIRLRDRGIAFNAYGESFKFSVRFDHMGTLSDKYIMEAGDVALTTYAHLLAKLWPDGCDSHTAELRAYCVSMRFEWENQIKNGRRFAMLNMLGK